MARYKKEEWKSIFWTIALILFIRWAIVEPFKIPSGSMIPTLLVGDHLFVSKSAYDIRIPFTETSLIKIADPQRGDVVVFKYPNHEAREEKEGLFYIKRIVGVPGDQIEVRGGIPRLATAPYVQDPVSPEVALDRIPQFYFDPAHRLFEEHVPGMNHKHWIQRYPYRIERLAEVVQELQSQSGKDCVDVGKLARGDVPFMHPSLINEICPFKVPEGQYFVMGDNRDDSADGREWGFVDRKLLKGRALFIWLSLNWGDNPDGQGQPFFRWRRLGLRIN